MRKVAPVVLLASLAPLLTAGTPSLEAGAIGPCALCATPTGFDGEARLSVERAEGRASTHEGEERSSRVETAVASAGLWQLGRDIAFGVTARREARRFEGAVASSGSSSHRETETRGRADLAAGPTLWLGSLGLAGTVGAAYLERESFSRDDASGAATITAEPVLAPSLTAAAGWRGRRILAALQTRLYDSAHSTVETRPEEGVVASQDVSRKPPDEVALHTRVEAHESLALGLSLEHAGNERGATGEVIVPQHATLTAGGVYSTPADVDLFASLRLEESSYDDARPPSLRHENLGGSRLAVGLDIDAGTLGVTLAFGYTSSGRVPRGGDAWEQKAWDLTAGISSSH